MESFLTVNTDGMKRLNGVENDLFTNRQAIARMYRQAAAAEVSILLVGWNRLETAKEDPLFRYFQNGEYVYYVHSFYARNCRESTLGLSRYGNAAVTGVVRRGNVWGTQFHPEKSGDAGLRLLRAFAEL